MGYFMLRVMLFFFFPIHSYELTWRRIFWNVGTVCMRKSVIAELVHPRPSLFQLEEDGRWHVLAHISSISIVAKSQFCSVMKLAFSCVSFDKWCLHMMIRLEEYFRNSRCGTCATLLQLHFQPVCWEHQFTCSADFIPVRIVCFATCLRMINT